MSNDNIPFPIPQGEFVLFQSEYGSKQVECWFESDTLWLPQSAVGSLYGKVKATISERISIFLKKGECIGDSVVRKYRTTATGHKLWKVKL